MASTPMDLDAPESSSPANGTPIPSSSLNIQRTLGGGLPSTSAVVDVIANYRPTKLFKRETADNNTGSTPHILSLDYDDPGELLMTSESDETIQIYKVKEGRHEKKLLSKKYGVKLAKFTRTSSSIIYASTKQNDAIRYLTTHDNSFVRYFEGHEAAVTCLAMHPGNDDFISCSRDNTVRLWNAGTKNATGLLHLNTPYLAAWDPSGTVFGVASPASGTVLLYDHRNFDKAPFAQFDVMESCGVTDPAFTTKGWTKLEFANDGKSILIGTRGGGHFVLDSFDGSMKAYLKKPESRSKRLAAGEEYSANGASSSAHEGNVESSGDCCFTPDGRFVLSGTRKGVVIWDISQQPEDPVKKILEPRYRMEDSRAAAVLAHNPRFNFFATADQELVFWVPDPHL
ncbi:WD repeat-containing protein [Microdochium trichocladiopsis]|uniref:WD repeat-containing protein n=1 Tax=Microdochium trichocladiopsis TaxID=1682393 RepID=A0A9P8YFH8_9PEZI|nr:WD repeat-containing protein [Microdochium trichocladiopsis]KAH7037952.1 WD repeat-containing protein [Microdochium trichocladiopsis]